MHGENFLLPSSCIFIIILLPHHSPLSNNKHLEQKKLEASKKDGTKRRKCELLRSSLLSPLSNNILLDLHGKLKKLEGHQEEWDDEEEVQAVRVHPSQSSLQLTGEEEVQVFDELLSQQPVEGCSIGLTWRKYQFGGHIEGYNEEELQAVDVHKSKSSHPVQSTLEERGEEVEVHVIEEQPSRSLVEQYSIGHVCLELGDGGHQEGWDDDVQVIDMQPSQSSCLAHPIVEPRSIVHACREEGIGGQLQEGRREEGVRVTEEQPSQSSEPVPTTVDIGKVVQRLDDLVERFTHLEQMTEATDIRRNSEYQFLCSEFFILSLHLGYSANAREPPIPPSFPQGSTTSRSTS